MWTHDDASRLSALDMDMRAGSSFQAGFDVCDPLESVLEWSGRGPARVQKRRCRSEGVDRSPYEDVPPHRSADGIQRSHRILPNKTQFTLNTALEAHFGRASHDHTPRVEENGDYIMTHEQHRYTHQQARTKAQVHRTSPTRALIISNITQKKVENKHLPKVEELLEKNEHDMVEVPVTKQPLKSILNNPLPITPPGILKKPKPKAYNESKYLDGRRRQRASSESDNLYSGFGLNNPLCAYDSRLYPNSNIKRVKDNSGTVYSYGTALALSNPIPKPNYYSKNIRTSPYKVPVVTPVKDMPPIEYLRTTAINCDDNTIIQDEILELTLAESPGSPRPLSCKSPELPVSSATAIPVLPVAHKKSHPKPLKKKAKPKKHAMKASLKEDPVTPEGPTLDGEVDVSRSPSPEIDPWIMETDILMHEISKLEKVKSPLKVQPPAPAPAPAPPPPPPKKEDVTERSIQKLSSKLNGTAVSPRKSTKDKLSANAILLTALHTINPFKVHPPIYKESPANFPDNVMSCIRPSLFPKVPPYLKFVSHDQSTPQKVPMPIQRHLKWKLTTITPIVVKKTLMNSGFKLVKSEVDTAECPQEENIEWIGIWGKHMKSLMFRAIKDGQKMNHFPGTFQVGRKDRLWRNLQKLVNKFGMKEFGIMPKSFVLPQDMKLLKRDWEKYAENNEKWIIKPPASARGTGIKVVSRWTQIPKKRPVVVQRYISNPYLINGSKFDMRLYVLVTSVHPLRIYMYKDGLARFASVKYNNELTSLNDRYMHLTNYSINRLSKNYTPNEDFAACEGHKWTLQTLFHYLKTEKKVDTKGLWESLKDLVIKTIISGEASISALTKANVTSRYNCYELFGVDVLLDSDLKPWLLEVNISPSLHSASPLDIHVKGPLVTTVLNIAQFQVPSKTNLDGLTKDKPHKLNGLPYDSRLYTVYLSKEERDKHIIYTNMDERDYLRDILSTLTPDDVRHLIQAEDELTQAGGDMERVFPTKDTHKYLMYLSGPRYYNRLFDAWETRYAGNRATGQELLRNLCDIGYHLEVPPVPLKNDVDAPSPPVSERAASATSVASVEPTLSAASVHRPRVCGDCLPQPPPPSAIEPRA